MVGHRGRLGRWHWPHRLTRHLPADRVARAENTRMTWLGHRGRLVADVRVGLA